MHDRDLHRWQMRIQYCCPGGRLRRRRVQRRCFGGKMRGVRRYRGGRGSGRGLHLSQARMRSERYARLLRVQHELGLCGRHRELHGRELRQSRLQASAH